jgi:5-formyltetrahydrofolate cyclo-ligase
VPGLAFDRRGGRLGRGKGYYDRFLLETSGLRVGICFEDQVVEKIPGEAHDLRMDFLITPAGIFPCAP